MVDQSTEEIMQNEQIAGSEQLQPPAQIPIDFPSPMGPPAEGQFENRETPITPRPPTLAELSE
jgi:hypothetical protein